MPDKEFAGRQQGPGVENQGLKGKDWPWGMKGRTTALRGPAGASRKGRARPQGGKTGPNRYRVWIAAVSDWQPQGCTDLPPTAIALEPAEEGTMSARQAARYVQAFNRVFLGRRPKVWAVALPVAIRYEGEPAPGERLGK